MPNLIASDLDNNSTVRSGAALLSASQMENNTSPPENDLATSSLLEISQKSTGEYKLLNQQPVNNSASSVKAAFEKDLRA